MLQPLAALPLVLLPQSYLRAHLEADAALLAGDGATASARFERCLERSQENPTAAYGVACARLLEGEREAALDWLERAVDWGYPDAALARWDEDLAGLREEPRFEAALERMTENGEPEETSALAAIQDALAENLVADAAIDRDARVVALAETSGHVQLLDARTGEKIRHSPELGSPAWAVEFHPDGEVLAALLHDGRAFLWEPGSDEPPRALDALTSPPERDFGWAFGAHVRFDPTGRRLLVAARDRGGSLWTADGELVRRWEQPLGHFFSVPAAWSPDGVRLALATEAGVRFFDASDGAEREPSLESTSPVEALDFHSDGQRIVVGCEDGRPRLWDLETRELLWTGPLPVDTAFGPPPVGCVRFSPDGRWLALTTVPGVEVDLLDAETGERVWTSGYLGGRGGERHLVRWSPDSRRFWYAFESGGMQLHVHELESEVTGALAVPALGSSRPPVVSPAGLAVTASWRGVAAIDARTGRFLWHRPTFDGERELLQAPQGWFTFTGPTTELDKDFAGLELRLPGESRRRPSIRARIERLCDPERVRAARAGVPLCAVAL